MKNPDQVYMVLDYETYSESPIEIVGGPEYSLHPSTEILCIAFKIGTRKTLLKSKTRLLLPEGPSEHFTTFCNSLLDPKIMLVAHNALFEQLITKNVFGKKMMYRNPKYQEIPIERWICSASMSRTVGLPGKLEGACIAMELKNQKDTEGHRIMLKLSKPKKATKTKAAIRFTPETNPEDFKILYDYCIKDTRAEAELFLKLPMLTPKEREFWILDQKINLRGFEVDRELVKGALKLIKKATKDLDKQVLEISKGKVNSARQHAKYLKLVKSTGLKIDNLKKETVDEKFKSLSDDHPAKKLLAIRKHSSRSSTAKFIKFDLRSAFDSRARDNSIFHGAHTGRQNGTGLQPLNLFKRTMDQCDVETGLILMKNRDAHTIEALYDYPMELYASALRSCIVAPRGKTLDVGDFATIETRVLFWLANHKKGLQMFERGEDLYIDLASSIYNIDAIKLLKKYKANDRDAAQKRQLGKQGVLGSGFGMGLNGIVFQRTAKGYGLDYSIELSKKTVRIFREKHPAIPRYWKVIEQAAKSAIINPHKKYRHGCLTWSMEEINGLPFLTVELPIGRKLYYFKPKLNRKREFWGESIEITYIGVDSSANKAMKFSRMSTWGGKLTENVVQAISRDLMLEAQLRIEKQGLTSPILSVHDEIIGEREKKIKNGLEKFLKCMEQVPDWCAGLPIKVEGWSEGRYRK